MRGRKTETKIRDVACNPRSLSMLSATPSFAHRSRHNSSAGGFSISHPRRHARGDVRRPVLDHIKIPPMNVTVYGLWHLGCVTAACVSAAGNRVVGLDPV